MKKFIKFIFFIEIYISLFFIKSYKFIFLLKLINLSVLSVINIMIISKNILIFIF